MGMGLSLGLHLGGQATGSAAAYTVTLTGLTDGEARQGDVIGLSINPAITTETVTYQWTQNGTNVSGATTSTETVAIGTDHTDGQTLRCVVTIDGTPYPSNGAVMKYAQPVAGADLDLSYPEDSAISTQNLLANWTLNSRAPQTVVSISPALPAGLSAAVVGTAINLTGTPTTVTADDTYTLTWDDQYGEEWSDTFTLEITVAADTTAPTTSAFTLGTQDSSGDIALTVTDLSENATVGFVFTTSDQSAATASAIKTAAEGGTALTDQAGISATQALTVGGGPYNISLPVLTDAAYYWQAALWDAAGNTTKYTGGTIQIDTTPPGISTLSPTDNGTGVAIDANLVITFTEGMKRQGTVELRNVGGALIESFDLSTDGTWSTVSQTDDRITLNPASDFVNGASLCVHWSGLEDDKGNALPDNSTDTEWNFDVVSASSGIALALLDHGFSTDTTTTSTSKTVSLDVTGHVAGDPIIVGIGSYHTSGGTPRFPSSVTFGAAGSMTKISGGDAQYVGDSFRPTASIWRITPGSAQTTVSITITFPAAVEVACATAVAAPSATSYVASTVVGGATSTNSYTLDLTTSLDDSVLNWVVTAFSSENKSFTGATEVADAANNDDGADFNYLLSIDNGVAAASPRAMSISGPSTSFRLTTSQLVVT